MYKCTACMALGILLSFKCVAGTDTTNESHAAAYGKAQAAVRPSPSGLIVCEAEEFSVGDGEWSAQPWGKNYFAGTTGNSFLSRKAFLGAPPQGEAAQAVREVMIEEAGNYLVLSRYEAAYRFQTQFKVKIEQAGRTVFERLYGARENLKIWALSGKTGKRISGEFVWIRSGATQGIVWEGHDAFVELAAGPATITLIADAQPAPAASRNVDLVLLTRDAEDINARINGPRRYDLPLDGLLTQEGDVPVRIHNKGGDALAVTFRTCREYSPRAVHFRNWEPLNVQVAPGETSEWVEIGGNIDTLNDSEVTVDASASAADIGYVLEFGRRGPDGEPKPNRTFDGRAGTKMRISIAGDYRYSGRVQRPDEIVRQFIDEIKRHPVHGRPPQRMLVYAMPFFRGDPVVPDEPYQQAQREFFDLFGVIVPGVWRWESEPNQWAGLGPEIPLERMEHSFKEITAQGPADGYAILNLGDEITLPWPPDGDHEGFRDWLKASGYQLQDILPDGQGDWDDVRYARDRQTFETHPRMYFLSHRYLHEFGIRTQKVRTDLGRTYLPNARIGANYTPHRVWNIPPHESALPVDYDYPTYRGHHYLGEVHQWVQIFRRGGMTMPWSEDWIWCVPVGTPQMNNISLDLFRAGVRHQDDPDICFYIMPHSPGNNHDMWRRLFYSALGHGMTVLDLFHLGPRVAASTENYCDSAEMHVAVRRGIHELGLFEDIVLDGKVRPGTAALWFSEVGDIWDDDKDPFAAAKRTLYIAIRQQQLPLDVVIEEDALDGTLYQYSVLYLQDRHVSLAASKAIADWVSRGGRLFATAGAGMFDEYNQPNPVMQELLGISDRSLDISAEQPVRFEKQDLPFAEPMDTVTWTQGEQTYMLPAIGARSRFEVADGEVQGRFADGSPAIVKRTLGEGRVLYCGFLPGLSYFKPAIPKRPTDLNSSSKAMAHFLPTAFDADASALINPLAADTPRPVVCSDPLVESMMIEAEQGTVIPLVNWTGKPIQGLEVMLNVPAPSKAELASGGPVQTLKRNDKTVIKLDLDVADAVILRHP